MKDKKKKELHICTGAKMCVAHAQCACVRKREKKRKRERERPA